MDALAIEELMPERVERRRDRVVRDGRYTSDGGTGGRMVLDGRVWLIQAKRHAGTIRPGHVRVFAVLRDARGAPGLHIHTRRAARSDRDLVTQHGEVDNISIHRLPAQITGGPLAIEGWAL